ncbi:MAG: (2Fe-2S) ferredoxin [Pseudomonadota bacterium]|jgi:2Fe-2S ferredoxin
MPTVHWTLPDGSAVSASVANGVNLMAAAVENQVRGIDGDCGGCLSCATCHVYVDPAWHERLGSAEGDESVLLDFAAAPRLPHSRLSCQLIASDALDGLQLAVPAS